jgi:S1-C subfamily serine protease
MNRALAAAVTAVAVAGCASLEPRADREVLSRILASVVQLRADLEDTDRRASSGVVIVSDPQSVRCWVITTRHLLQPTGPRRLSARLPGHEGSHGAEVLKIHDQLDLAILSVQGVAPPAVTLKDVTGLGQDVWVVGFPWGRRLTVVRGVVSQLAGDGHETRLEGPAVMVDASVSYGASGGGIFEVSTGLLIGIVEGYRTARVALPHAPESVFHVPVPGETTVVSSAAVRRFLSSAGLDVK